MILRFCFLLLLLTPSISHARLIDKTVALVNSDVITLSDTENFQRDFNLRKEIDPFVGFLHVSPQKTNDIRDYLIQEALIQQKFPPTTEEIEEEINAVQKNNQIDRERLKAVLASQGVKFDSYQALMKISVSKRKLMDRELRPLSNVSDEDVKNYYYTAPEYSETKKAQKLVLTYDIAQMEIPTQALSQEVSKRLHAGEDFDALASSMNNQGIEVRQLGSFSEENLSEKIRDALNGLKVGEASDPISTGAGYQILKINKIGAPKDAQFEKNKEQIRNQLVQKTMSSQLSIWTDKERAQAYIYLP